VKRCFLALPALLLAGPQAHAEYPGTRWGMTPDEVLAAIGADARKVKDKRDDRLLGHQKLAVSTLQDGGIDYAAAYYFGEQGTGLTMVYLLPKTPEKDCAAMRKTYGERLGPADGQKSREVFPGLEEEKILWRTGPGDEIAEYIEVRIRGSVSHCQMLYQQRDFEKK